MPKRTRDHHSWLMAQLTNGVVAANYLKASIEDSHETFLVALRNIAEAHRVAKVAEEAGLSRESLYRTLSEDGNPRLDTLYAVLAAVGLRISVEPINQESTALQTSHIALGTDLAQQAQQVIGLGNQQTPMQRFLATPSESRFGLESHADH